MANFFLKISDDAMVDPGVEKTFWEKSSHFARMRAINILREMCDTIPFITKYRDDATLYTKVIVSSFRLYEREVDNYRKLDGLIPLPKLIHHQSLFRGELREEDDYPDEVETFHVSLIVTTRCGRSISDVYFNGGKQGPGIRSNCPDVIDECFPGIPQDVQNKIQDIFNRLHSLGIVHDDVHSGNFLIDENGNVTMIDLALMSILPPS